MGNHRDEVQVVRIEGFALYLGEGLPHDVPERGRYFLNVTKLVGDGDKTVPSGSFLQVELNRKHGLDLTMMPVALDKGYKRVKSVEDIADLLGATPFVIRGFYAVVDEGLTTTRDERTIGKHVVRFGRRVELDEGYFYLTSTEAIEPGSLVEIKFVCKGNMVVAKADFETTNAHHCDSWEAFVMAAQENKKLHRFELFDYCEATVLLVGLSLDHLGERGAYMARKRIDHPGVEGGMLDLYFIGGDEPIPSGSVVRIRYMGKSMFSVAHVEGKSVSGYLKHWEDVPELLGLSMENVPTIKA